MKLLGIESIDALGVENGVYSFAKSPTEAHDRVLITGGPGSGKTRLLELIIAAREAMATGQRLLEQMSFIRPGNQTCKVILTWQLDAEEQATIGASSPAVSTELIFRFEEEDELDQRLTFLFERYSHDDAVGKFEYFSERRRLDVGGGEPEIHEEEQAGQRTNPNPRKFSWLPSFLARLPDQPEKGERFAKTLATFSPSCSYDRERHVLMSRGRALRELTELSASEADSVIFSATATLVGLSNSIILVDRPELCGIDPARAMAGLGALGTNNQIILASPSPAFAAGFDGAVVRLGSEVNTPRASG